MISFSVFVIEIVMIENNSELLVLLLFKIDRFPTKIYKLYPNKQ